MGSNFPSELSQSALSGGRKLLAYCIAAAHKANRRFVAGPVWNHADALIPGETQYLRYAFDRSITKEVAFSTADLEQYGLGEPATTLKLNEAVHAVLVVNSENSKGPGPD